VTELTAIEYSAENDDGTTYLIKTNIGDDTDFVYVKIHLPPPQSETETNPVLADVMFKSEEIEYY
jgi:hypothetical protein